MKFALLVSDLKFDASVTFWNKLTSEKLKVNQFRIETYCQVLRSETLWWRCHLRELLLCLAYKKGFILWIQFPWVCAIDYLYYLHIHKIEMQSIETTAKKLWIFWFRLGFFVNLQMTSSVYIACINTYHILIKKYHRHLEAPS